MLDIALKVLNKISDFGYQAYIIGGYPRDLYLKEVVQTLIFVLTPHQKR
ncbi:MAG: hypothetical protein IJ093_02675 [Bacilli bacterium]|nr:hypothetical protein [Bacilli bacterium]